MRTRSSSNLVGNSFSNPTTSNPKHRNRRRSNQRVEPFAFEESPVVTMADQRTMVELLRAPTEGYAEAIMVPPILAEHFELKHSPINMMTSDQFFGLEKDNPHDHIRWFNKITSTIKYKDVPNSAIKLMLFPFSLAGEARRWLEKEPPRSILTWEDLSFHEAWDRYKDLLRACPHHGFTELHQLDTFYNALNTADQDSLNSAVGGNLLERMMVILLLPLTLRHRDTINAAAGGTFMKRRPEECYDLIENMTAHHNDWDTSAQRNESSSSITSSNPEIASLKLQMEEMNRNLTRMLQTNQQVNTVTPSCETCGGPHSYNDCPATVGQNQNVYAVGAYNQGGNSYQPQGNRNLLSYRSDNYLGPPGFNVNQNQNRSNQNQNNQVQPYQNRNQGNNQSNNQGRNQFFQGANHNQNQVQNYQAPNTQPPVALPQELTNYIRINENKINSMQTQMNNLATSNQRLESMLGNFIKMNTASSSGTGSLPSNTVANPKGELKAITTRSGLVLDEPSVPMPPPFINPEEDERVEETFTDPEHGEFTIKVPPPLVQKAKQRNFVIHQRDPRHPNIPYPSRMNQEKQKEKDEVQIHKFWQMFKQLHINITLADALILIPKYQKMLKSLLSNKEKLIELANTPVSENCSTVILKKLPEKLGDSGKFLIPCGFSELKCKALADLGASINLMPLSMWKELGLPELISTRMTLELANRNIFTPKGIARDVFISVGKFTFPADFVIVDYESDPRVPLILGRPFLRTARALIDVHGEEMILRDGNERLILNMINDTSSYSNEPHQESISMIDVYNVSHEEIREDLFATNHPSGNPTSSLTSHTNLTSPKVNDDIFDPKEDIIENLLNLDKTKDLPPYHDNQSSGNPTPISELETKYSSSSPKLISLEESELIWEEFEAYLASDSFPPGNDDLPIDVESDLLELEYLLNHDPIKDMDSILEDSVDENSLNNNLDDTISEEFADELAPSESFPPGNYDMTLEDVIKEVKCLPTQSPLANYSLNN
ncbi:reverse transcriptase domain-containing protein, partial [Tanacetum coccineum]